MLVSAESQSRIGLSELLGAFYIQVVNAGGDISCRTYLHRIIGYLSDIFIELANRPRYIYLYASDNILLDNKR